MSNKWYMSPLTLVKTKRTIVVIDHVFQALTTQRKIRFPIGQPADKNQVAPINNQVAPFAKPYCKQ